MATRIPRIQHSASFQTKDISIMSAPIRRNARPALLGAVRENVEEGKCSQKSLYESKDL